MSMKDRARWLALPRLTSDQIGLLKKAVANWPKVARELGPGYEEPELLPRVQAYLAFEEKRELAFILRLVDLLDADD